ncbi:YraN family protein [Puniceicoccaceae bacterium K14]|nr:YraN family protein [Puniceicoccaceae bacterium K14]
MLGFLFNRRKEKANNGEIGALGERAAERLLKRKGFRILHRNWRSGKDEIDIVCSTESILVFVEVKTRKVGALVSGYEAVDGRKKKALLRVCRSYLYKLKGEARSPRFDIVEIEHDEGRLVGERHFENVPLFPKSVSRGSK